MKNLILILTVIIIIFAGGLLRFYDLGGMPPGLNIDESSMGINALSLLETGRDRYSKELPVLFRSFGSFQAPLYTYLSVIPVSIVGANTFSIRVVSAVFGLIAVLSTYLIILRFKEEKGTSFALLSAAFLVIAPWAVFFSRIATEANLAFGLFTLAVLSLVLAFKRPWFYVVGCFLLGLTTHAYYSERLTAMIFLAVFTYFFRSYFLKEKRWVIAGVGLFLLTQVPHLFVAGTGALTRRVEQVYYLNESFFLQNGGDLRNIPFIGKWVYYLREFFSQYLAYFSPKNLFFDPDPQGARAIPNLSVFYSWMIIPFALGLRYIIKNFRLPIVKLILILTFIGPIPAALSRDPFYTLRALIFLWAVTLIIALGFHEGLGILARRIKNQSMSFAFKQATIIGLLLFSISSLYLSYFIVGRYERGESYGYSYVKLLDKINEFKEDKFVVDSSRDLAIGVRYAYLLHYNPKILQQELGPQVSGRYYSSVEFDEPYTLGQIEARPIVWEEDVYKDYILVGDNLAVSENQVKEHKLQPLFEVTDMTGKVALKAYRTNPKEKCESSIGESKCERLN